MSNNANPQTRTNEQALQNLRAVVTHDSLRFLNARETIEVLQSLEQLDQLVKSLAALKDAEIPLKQ